MMRKAPLRLLLLACCTCMLSSCSSIFNLLESIISLPFDIINSIIP